MFPSYRCDKSGTIYLDLYGLGIYGGQVHFADCNAKYPFVEKDFSEFILRLLELPTNLKGRLFFFFPHYEAIASMDSPNFRIGLMLPRGNTLEDFIEKRESLTYVLQSGRNYFHYSYRTPFPELRHYVTVVSKGNIEYIGKKVPKELLLLELV